MVLFGRRAWAMSWACGWAMAAGLFLGEARGQTTWLGTTDSAWSTATNWSDGAVPTNTMPVVFDSTSGTTGPSITATANAKNLTVTNPSGQITVDLSSVLNVAGGIDLSAATADLRLGSNVTTGTVNLTQTGTVAVAAGRTLTFGGKLTAFTGGTSSAYTIDGPGLVVASGTVNIAAPTTIRSGSFMTTLTSNVSQPVVVAGGYLAMNGVDGNQNFIIGSSGTAASYTQTSGTSFFTRFQVRTAAVTMAGGTAWLGGLQLGTAANVTSSFTITGSASVSGTWGANFGIGTNAVARLYLSGGTMTMNSMPSGTSATASKSITFDGTVLRPSGTGVVLVRSLNNAWLASNGAIVDTNGYTASITQALTDGTAPGTAGPFTKLGSGTLTLSGSSTYSGATTIAAGVIEAGNASALGSGAITFTNGGLRYTAASATQDWGGRIRNSTSAVTLDPNGQRVTLTGIDATNVGGLTVGGTGGTVALVGTSSYAGPTSVNGSTLEVDGLITGSGAVTVAAGATLAGTGTVGGDTTITTGATIAPGASPGTLSFSGGLTWNAGGNYNWQMLSGTGTAGGVDFWDLVRAGGPLTIAATAADPFRLNLWTLSGTGPDSNGPAVNFDGTQNYSWRIATATGGITGFAANKFLIETSATNGTGGFMNSTEGGTFSIAQSGNDLNLVFTSTTGPTVITINVASGTQTQGEAGYPLLSGSTPVVKTGAGMLVVDQANTLTGSTTVQGGVLQLANATALSASRLVVVAGGTGQVAPYTSTSVAGLDLATGTGLIDLTSGALTISAGMTATQLVAEIIEGRGADGTWSGTSGITSSTAAGDVALSVPRAVGWVDNGDGSLTAAYAAPGDTNIDWSIDILDASNFLALGKFDTGLPATWVEGDFSYDGLVDILDAADFFATGLYDAGNYNTAPGIGPTPDGGGLGRAGDVAAVPEPDGSLLWMAVAAGMTLACRVRRCWRTEAGLVS